MSGWILADQALQKDSANNSPDIPASLKNWPPYGAVLSKDQVGARSRLYSRVHSPSSSSSGSVAGAGRNSYTTASATSVYAGQSSRSLLSGVTSPSSTPDPEWVVTVLTDWLTLLYDEVKGPLEPLLGCVRKLLFEDSQIEDTSERLFYNTIKLPIMAEKVTMEVQLLPNGAAGKYDAVLKRLSDYYEPWNPLRRLLCDSWLWVWHGTPETIIPLALECFVEQASPCCAAASSATAINMLLKRPRQTYTDCRKSDYSSISSSSTSLFGSIGRSSPTGAFKATDAIAVMDKDLVDSIGKLINTMSLDIPCNIAEHICNRIARDMSPPSGPLYFPPPTTKDQQQTVLEAIKQAFIDIGTKDSELFSQLKYGCPRPKCKPIIRNLYIFVSNIWGLAKLRCRKPSTARFGSWGVVMAIEKLTSLHSLGISAITQVLTEYSWADFKKMVMRPQTSVILHLPNHYATVYGFRDNEILTARKGQPPTDWISWEELIATQNRNKEGCMIVAYMTTNPPALKASMKSIAASRAGKQPAAADSASAGSSVSSSSKPIKQNSNSGTLGPRRLKKASTTKAPVRACPVVMLGGRSVNS
eukprot:TRINITY_DN10522_c0_g2_i1.p1 TRINITY_DN10522_c0_g2~~TRINITY_DN10522_c0_g2_i1.p1  ORF type:complete len:622 (+),score=89.99 TRINITY_DN10522_c0_g2_i1:110-1867(+)